MLKSDIINRYPWFEKEHYQLEVFKIAATLCMDIKDVLETLDIMLGKHCSQSDVNKIQGIANLANNNEVRSQKNTVQAA